MQESKWTPLGTGKLKLNVDKNTKKARLGMIPPCAEYWLRQRAEAEVEAGAEAEAEAEAGAEERLLMCALVFNCLFLQYFVWNPPRHQYS